MMDSYNNMKLDELKCNYCLKPGEFFDTIRNPELAKLPKRIPDGKVELTRCSRCRTTY